MTIEYCLNSELSPLISVLRQGNLKAIIINSSEGDFSPRKITPVCECDRIGVAIVIPLDHSHLSPCAKLHEFNFTLQQVFREIQ